MTTIPLKTCPICLESPKRFVFLKKQIVGDQSLDLFQCDFCKVQFWFPLLNQGSQWYEGQYDQDDYDFIQNFRNVFNLFIARHDLHNKKIFDVGCGAGAFLGAVKKCGGDVFGVDFNRHAIEFIKKQYQIDTVYLVDNFKNFFSTTIETYDYVSCFEVLEHQDDPLAFLRQIGKLIRRDGLLVLSVPFRDSACFECNSFECPPNHLTRWNKESLSNILTRANLSIVAMRRVDDFDLTFDTYRTFVRKLNLGERNRFLARPLSVFLEKALYRIAYPISMIFCNVKNMLRLGNSLYVECVTTHNHA